MVGTNKLKMPKTVKATVKRNWRAIVYFHDDSQTTIEFDTWPEFDGTLADGPAREWIRNIFIVPDNQAPVGELSAKDLFDAQSQSNHADGLGNGPARDIT